MRRITSVLPALTGVLAVSLAISIIFGTLAAGLLVVGLALLVLDGRN